MGDLAEHYAFRKRLVDLLQDDLLGPVGGEHEVIDEEPATAYIAGILFPSRDTTGARDQRRMEMDVDLSVAQMSVDEIPDTGVSMANRQMPSAIGMTFAADTALTTTVRVEIAAAVYEPIDEQGRVVAARRTENRGSDEAVETRWRRTPVDVAPEDVDLLEPGSTTRPVGDRDGLELRTRVRAPDARGIVTVTVTLVNALTATNNELVDARCFFQPVLRVTVPGPVPALVERPWKSSQALTEGSDDETANRLLHRHAPMFATGHGCATEWDWCPPEMRGRRRPEPACTDAVWTSVLPARDVMLTESNPDVAEPGMLTLAVATENELFRMLRGLVDGYEEWIVDRTADADGLAGSEFMRSAEDQLEACREARRRMESGIRLLRDDPVALRAFRMANEVMAAQRGRSAWIRGGRVGDPELDRARWRPFQIGFLLQCLDGIVDCDHPDRNIADVLWFPTGGGKTEAYFGLIAFTSFLRRMRSGSRGAGVTVLMRYTLRLLTLQQFERAATLICAMEELRRRKSDFLGRQPFSIGMWVGRDATPNTLEEAAKSLKELDGGAKLQKQNPVQLRTCPWCGTAMDHRDYVVTLDTCVMRIRCPGECEFRAGLPVHVVDEEIYSAQPTLIIATADKFAQIAWRAPVARLFNREGAIEGTPPPELVIQDELHLISGPLGSLAGLYETAIDLAAGRPKIVASTATIRRAKQQGRALFDREVRQFPPAGLDARDSWFAVEASHDTKASRMYVGLFTPSSSQATLLIRTYAALLHHAALIDGSDRVRDAYWTVIGYFNSLRLLSAAELQVHADVDQRLKQLAHRDGVVAREVNGLTELTSRVESSEIPRHLQELFVALGSGGGDPIDVVLATNMISVGVDVDRLGLMAVMGQPQTTAEYIQATSRVGRRDPGLVVTLLNAARSRDRSHYENFVPYHSALYRQVESTSVTPFASRARDRALHAVLVGLVRLLHPVARPNDAAGRVDEFRKELREVRSLMLDRVSKISPADTAEVQTELDRFIDDWEALADGNPLVYEAKARGWPGRQRRSNSALLRSYEKDDDLTEATDTMWSLRDVDVESHLYLER